MYTTTYLSESLSHTTLQSLYIYSLLYYIILLYTYIYFKKCTKNIRYYTDKEYWTSLGRAELDEALNVAMNNKVAKNVILFIGDGMGPNTVTASRIYKNGEKGRLTFEKFPHLGLLKVSNLLHEIGNNITLTTLLSY